MLRRPADDLDGGLVCLGHAYLWHEGQQVLSSLRAAGFHAFLLDTQNHTTSCYYNLALGGQRLVVASGEARAACDFLEQMPPVTATRFRSHVLAVFLLLWLGHLAGIFLYLSPPAWRGFYLRRPAVERKM